MAGQRVTAETSSHETGLVRSEVRGRVAVVSLTRPDRLNALTSETLAQLRAALTAVGERRDVHAVVLRGEGQAFCAGLDLEVGIADPTVSDPVGRVRAGMRLGLETVWAMRSIPQPVVAVVQGHAVGAGFAFAAAADVRLIGPGARFSAPFLRLGMSVGDLGLSWFLPRIIGHGRAADLFYSAGVLDAEQAVAYGMASHVSDDPMAEAMAYAERLAAFPPYGVQASKDLINASASSSLRDHLDAEARAQVIGALTEDAQLAMSTALVRAKERR